MNVARWLVAIAILLPVAWFAIKVAVSVLVPKKVSGVMLLKQELRTRGVPCEQLPAAFFDDAVDGALRLATFRGHGSSSSATAAFVESLETLAQVLAIGRADKTSPMFADHGDVPNSYRTLFEKHGIT